MQHIVINLAIELAIDQAAEHSTCKKPIMDLKHTTWRKLIYVATEPAIDHAAEHSTCRN